MTGHFWSIGCTITTRWGIRQWQHAGRDVGNESIPTCRSVFQCELTTPAARPFNCKCQIECNRVLLLFSLQLICSVDPRLLKLTPFDDQIYQTFREDFPDFDVGKVDENELKNPASKTKWRTFIEKFNKLEDFSYGTLMRADATQDFGPHNSVLVVRVQFWAIEIARNREGYNDKIRYTYKPQVTETTQLE